MRLWPFGRRDHIGAPSPAHSSAGSPDSVGRSTTTASAAIVTPARPVRPVNEWMQLAPLTRTSGPAPLVAPLSRIATGLAAKNDTGMTLAPLGHERRNDAPIGTISNAIVPTGRQSTAAIRTDTPTLEHARPATASAEPQPVPTLRWNGTIDDRPAESARRSASPTIGPTPFAAPVAAPSSRHAAVAPTAGRSPTATPVAADLALPAAAPARRLASKVVATPMTVTAATAEPLPLGRPAPTRSTEPSTISDTPARPASPAATASGSTPSADEPNTPRPLAGARTVHRRRLGEPLAHRPSTMVASVSTTSELPNRIAPQSEPTPDTQRTVVPQRVAATKGALPQRITRATVSTSTRQTESADRQPGQARTSALPSTAATGPTARRDMTDATSRRSTPLVGERARLSTQQPRTDGHPAGPAGAPMPVSVVQRESHAKPVVALHREPRREPTADTTADTGADTAPSAAPAGSMSATPAGSAPAGSTSSASRPSSAASVPGRPTGKRGSRQPSTESVPADLSAQLGPMLGADLSNVPVHRGPTSAQTASDLQARAFTVESEVHLPERLGPTSHGEGRETLAHELTHVVQQRRLGALKPDEASAVGEQMEAEARMVARRVAAPQRATVAPPAPRRPTVQMFHAAARPADPAAPAQPTSSLTHEQQRSMVSQIENAAMSSGVATRVANNSVAFGGTSPSGSMTASAGGVQREPEHSNAAVPTPTVAPSAAVEDAMSPEKLDELATRLYDGIQSRLRRDLLLQRERSGSLFDRR